MKRSFQKLFIWCHSRKLTRYFCNVQIVYFVLVAMKDKHTFWLKPEINSFVLSFVRSFVRSFVHSFIHTCI